MRPSSQLPEAVGVHDAEIAGIDALEIPIEPHPSLASRVWRATWPVVVAVVAVIALWQFAYVVEWRPHSALPSPMTIARDGVRLWQEGRLQAEVQTTMWRAVLGYAAAFVVGSIIGLLVVGNRVLRRATGSLITGLQTMPSIAWFPLAILFYGITETAIFFVMVLGAAPAIANGLISAADQISPTLLSAGRVLGATGIKKYRHVVIPAAMPAFIGGMKQGWAFLWRSLMAGELLVIIAEKPSLGVGLQIAKEFANAEGLLVRMIVILLIGIFVDRLFFARLDNAIRVRWGLGDAI